ncbi:MAG: hypothetical protein CEN87_404 [Parcubacteria group bacterium Licking1014_1]|nr:MAG: hypothetical protein CEN87_404 [Parcubacteria group bacterium Licking1014_1]
MITIGVERERFIISRADGKIVSAIGVLLPKVQCVAEERGLPANLFSYELFAGQIEDRTLPCDSLPMLRAALIANDSVMDEVANQNGLAFDFSEFVEENQIASLEVNPFDQRHKNIWQSISPERKLAASIVAAVHIHLAVTENVAVQLLNACRKEMIERLTKIGDHSSGRRMVAYTTMAQTDGVPPVFSGFREVIKYIDERGGEKNVWDLVRYKPSTGTIEFRMFGATESVEEVIGYALACIELLKIF